MCMVRDADGDGAASIACGGGDCDDADPNRYPTNPEICDAAEHDEDCVRDTVGPDLDEDGFEDQRCCARWEGETVCGEDCDDGDPTVNPSRTETCNGRDDDCDGTTDEGFECPAGATVSGTNACGHEGERRCSSTCEWEEADFLRPESRSTCDYCSDSGMGLDDERPFASENFTFGNGSFRPNLYGDAAPEPVGGGINLTDGGVGSAVSMRTGIFGPSLRVGYGNLWIVADVEVSRTSGSVSGGWAISVVRETPGAAFVGRPLSRFGAPQDRDGIGVGWTFGGVDDIEMFRLGSGSSIALPLSPRLRRDVVPGARFPEAGGTTMQTLSMLITPDRPDTSADEFAVLVNAYGVDGARTSIQCANDPRISVFPCGSPLQVGERVFVVVSAATTGCSVVLDATSGDIGRICPGT